jgi:type II secretory pathway pseudopilin PulG
MPLPGTNGKMGLTANHAALRQTTLRELLFPAVLRSEAFTLLELLIVIGIIATFFGLAFPIFQSVQDRAKRVEAKNDLIQVVTAANAFYTEYGRYPTDQSTDAAATYGGGGSSNKFVLDELRAKTATLNTRQIVFISPAEDTSQPSPKGKIGSDGQFHDPWSSAYAFRMDADYNNEVANPYGTNGAGVDPVRQGVIGWSFGKDRQIGNKGDQKFTNSDDVISWQ